MIRTPAPYIRYAITGFLFIVAGCGGGDSSDTAGTDPQTQSCDGSCANASSVLTVNEIERILAQAINESQARGVTATIAVVDRVGNVLAVFRMGNSASRSLLIATRLDASGQPVIDAGLEGIELPTAAIDANLDQLAAISKAVTGAYLSSEGNAFTTRTANQIVQEHFNPGEFNQPGGPLFGVQFSQLPCSDFSSRFNDVGASTVVGPRRAPLGLSADPGGLPLYKGGTVVGGVGVLADGLYSIDPVIADTDLDVDELIALAATFGFAAPADRRGDRITVDGKTFRFSDATFGDLIADPSTAPDFSAFDGVVGNLIAVEGYTFGAIVRGTAFGTPQSGIRPDGGALYPGLDAFVFVDDANLNRYPPIGGTDGVAALSAGEVQTLLQAALGVANRSRAQIRRPLGTPARVTISVVDTQGVILGMVRGRDAPVFGADVSLQKARTAAFFSAAGSDAFLQNLPDAVYIQFTDMGIQETGRIVLGDYVNALRAFLNDPTALANGSVAFSDRAGGNLSRPFYPDGLNDEPPGPLSKPPGEWSVFSTGLQLDLSINAILQHALFAAAGVFPDVPGGPNVPAGNPVGCAGVEALSVNPPAFSSTVSVRKMANGSQIFPGSVPIYRGSTLVGGIGVSGDGVDQDDMIGFLGVHRAGQLLGGAVNNAPNSIRADQLAPQGVRLRYVQCPQSPFLDSDEQKVCDGK